MTPQLLNYILGMISLVSVLFVIYGKFHTPQEDMEKKQLLVNKDLEDKATILSQKEVEKKAELLAQQVESERRMNEGRFTEMGRKIEASMTLAQNHIHTVQVNVEMLTTKVNEMNINIAKLSTIIEERLPKK